jgi:hypothetical protein
MNTNGFKPNPLIEVQVLLNSIWLLYLATKDNTVEENTVVLKRIMEDSDVKHMVGEITDVIKGIDFEKVMSKIEPIMKEQLAFIMPEKSNPPAVDVKVTDVSVSTPTPLSAINAPDKVVPSADLLAKGFSAT